MSPALYPRMINLGEPRSGRTTRMLTEAVHEAGHGRYVLVIVAVAASRIPTMRAAHQIADSLGFVTDQIGGDLTVKLLVNQGQISFETAAPPFDWQTLHKRGDDPSCLVKIDHYALEWELIRHYGEAIRHVERWVIENNLAAYHQLEAAAHQLISAWRTSRLSSDDYDRLAEKLDAVTTTKAQ